MNVSTIRNIIKSKLLNLSNTCKYSTSHNERIYVEIISKDSFIWPETRLGDLEPQDIRFPLPGFVGPQNNKKKVEKKTGVYDADILVAPLKHEHQSNILQQFLNLNEPQRNKENELNNDISLFENFNYSVQQCPFLLKHDLQILLKAQGLMNHKLTVITFYQKHSRDSSDDLYKQFVDSATQICDSLFSVGFWASFIDPYLNQSYADDQINRKQYEVDTLYKNFSVQVLNSGKCQVTKYKKIGASRFLGCLVTTAPPHHPLILFFSDQST